MLKLSLKQGEYLNIGDNIRVVYAGGAGKIPIMLSRVFRKKHRQRSKRFYGMNA
ncbi:MAG: carbon storage regulator [Roseburia inulinivorans]